MTNLDVLLLKGCTSANPEESLRELRYAILTDGVPANSDGMVCPTIQSLPTYSNCSHHTSSPSYASTSGSSSSTPHPSAPTSTST
jgi:hypothetical protein